MTQVALGIDIGGTNTPFGIVDQDGKILAESSISTKGFDKIEDYINTLQEAIKGLMEQVPGVELNGIGIGAPSGNFYKGTIEHAPNLVWKGILPLKKLMQAHFDVPVVVTNDANAAAVGEMLFGAAKGMENFLLFTLGTGVGSGVVVNGELIYGHDGFAGEIGHTNSIPDGRQCGCGRRGCFEAYLSVTGLRQTVKEMLDKLDWPSELREMNREDISGRHIFEAAQRGDRISKEAFEYSGKLMGIKFADAVCYTSPEAIIIFGGLARAGDLLIRPAKKHMEEHMLHVFKNKVRILPSALLDKNAAVLGASALVWQLLNKMEKAESR